MAFPTTIIVSCTGGFATSRSMLSLLSYSNAALIVNRVNENQHRNRMTVTALATVSGVKLSGPDEFMSTPFQGILELCIKCADEIFIVENSDEPKTIDQDYLEAHLAPLPRLKLRQKISRTFRGLDGADDYDGETSEYESALSEQEEFNEA